MKIIVGLFGFGKTGSIVAKEIMNDEAFELRWVLRKSSNNEGEFASRILGLDYDAGKIFSMQNTDFEHFYTENMVDVIIDFSSPDSVYKYKNAAKNGIRIVSAISHYKKEELEQLKMFSKETAVLYSPNITLGVNFLIESSKMLQKIIPNSHIEIIEEHFKGKEGVSGTALRIAENLDIDKNTHVNSVRVGGIVGTHEVIFGLPHQTIRIKHESLSRAAFGQGAMYAAKWIMKKEKNMYSMENAITSFFNQS